MSLGRHDAGPATPDRQAPRTFPDAEDLPGRPAPGADAGQADAGDRGGTIVQAARAEAAGFLENRKNDAARVVSEFADALREAGRTLGEGGAAPALVGGAAEGLDSFADVIRSSSFAEVYGALEDRLRRRPAAVAAVALFAGFLVSRFARASTEAARDRSPRATERIRDAGGSRPSAGQP